MQEKLQFGIGNDTLIMEIGPVFPLFFPWE